MPVRGFKSVQDANIAVDPFLSESTLRILQYLGGNSYHKTDKEGYPLLIDRAGYHRTKDIGNNVTATEMINYEVACAEFLTRVLNPECSETAGRYIHGQTMIFDCTDMSFWQFQMSAIQHFKAVMNVVQSYYPETLHKVFIVNASAVFVAMWKVMQTFVNARTLEKVHIIGQDYQNVLLEHIPAENLPTFLGGTCECKHLPGGCVPSSNMGNVPPLKYILGNEKVETAYITDVMDL
ncbi:hypothetical protein DFQ30_005232 [Apophysomyces sp. BC1015]|nr:hypothetical protein DFQ30_005232 [Apophysomyces sp. BC1015]